MIVRGEEITADSVLEADDYPFSYMYLSANGSRWIHKTGKLSPARPYLGTERDLTDIMVSHYQPPDTIVVHAGWPARFTRTLLELHRPS